MTSSLTVFISSTFEDLREARRSVVEAILGLGCRPIGMEHFSAANRPPWDHIKREIDQADCCVTIVAGRYGSVDKNGVSYTEKEYNYALRQEKPLLTFLRKDITTLPVRKVDRDPKLRRKLQAFRKKCKRKQILFWENESNLSSVVTRSLAKFIQENLGHVLGRSSELNIREEVRVVTKDRGVLLYARKLKIPQPGVQTLLSCGLNLALALNF